MSDICRNSGANFNLKGSPIHSGARDKNAFLFCSMFTDVALLYVVCCFFAIEKIKKNSSVRVREIIDGFWYRRE